MKHSSKNLGDIPINYKLFCIESETVYRVLNKKVHYVQKNNEYQPWTSETAVSTTVNASVDSSCLKPVITNWLVMTAKKLLLLMNQCIKVHLSSSKAS